MLEDTPPDQWILYKHFSSLCSSWARRCDTYIDTYVALFLSPRFSYRNMFGRWFCLHHQMKMEAYSIWSSRCSWSLSLSLSLDQRPNAEGSIVELPLNTPPFKGFPNVQFQCVQISNLNVKLPPFMTFLSLLFQSTTPKTKLKWWFHCMQDIQEYHFKPQMGAADSLWRVNRERQELAFKYTSLFTHMQGQHRSTSSPWGHLGQQDFEGGTF